MDLAATAAELFIKGILKEPLLHGDDAHRKWLTEELTKHTGTLASIIRNVQGSTVAEFRTALNKAVDQEIERLWTQ